MAGPNRSVGLPAQHRSGVFGSVLDPELLQRTGLRVRRSGGSTDRAASGILAAGHRLPAGTAATAGAAEIAALAVDRRRRGGAPGGRPGAGAGHRQQLHTGIHHGGAGTTGKALQAGVPNIILPFTSDQPFWGRQVYKLGAGPKPLNPKKISSRQISEAIRLVLNDQEIKDQAREIGKRISAENGTETAIKLIERYGSLR